MAIFTQLLVNSIIVGAIYALVASGFSLIYATNRFVHFAHGAVIIVAGYILYGFTQGLGIPISVSILLTLLLTSIFGFLQYKCIYLPLKKRNSSTIIMLIASVALMILFENLILLFAGSSVKTFSFITTQRGAETLGFLITPIQITIILTSLVIFTLLWILLKKTTLGKQLRAVADNPDLANITGISATKIASFSFFIGSAMAGLAGMLIAIEQNLEPFMGTRLIIKGFTAAIIGGINRVEGAILGALILGLTENFGIWFLPSGYKDAISFTLLIGFLIFKPTGVLGINKGHKQ